MKYSILFATQPVLSYNMGLTSLVCTTECFFSRQVTEIRLKYFDTVPVAAAMCVLKTGFLFVASEFGNQ